MKERILRRDCNLPKQRDLNKQNVEELVCIESAHSEKPEKLGGKERMVHTKAKERDAN